MAKVKNVNMMKQANKQSNRWNEKQSAKAIRQELLIIPMPEDGWEDKVFAITQAEAQQENANKRRGSQQKHSSKISLSLLADRFARSSYGAPLVVIAMLLLTLYLQPIASLYNSNTGHNQGAVSGVSIESSSVTHLDDVFITGADVIIEELASYVALSEDNIWDDSWLLNE